MTPIRKRTRKPKTDPTAPLSDWPMNSAVWKEGCAGVYTDLLEEQKGFLGRILRDSDGRYRVWRFRRGWYKWAGYADTFAGALILV